MSRVERFSSQANAVYVFDTNVFVAALRSRRGASFVILNAIRQNLITGAASQALLLEYEDVFTRDTNLKNFWATADEVSATIGAITCRLVPVPIYFRWRPLLSDPNDEIVIECAINASADAIITFNKRDFLPAATRFGINILSSGEFVQKLRLVEN